MAAPASALSVPNGGRNCKWRTGSMTYATPKSLDTPGLKSCCTTRRVTQGRARAQRRSLAIPATSKSNYSGSEAASAPDSSGAQTPPARGLARRLSATDPRPPTALLGVQGLQPCRGLPSASAPTRRAGRVGERGGRVGGSRASGDVDVADGGHVMRWTLRGQSWAAGWSQYRGP